MKKSTNHRLAQAVALTLAASAVFTSASQANYLYVGGFNLAGTGTFNLSAPTDTVANASLNGLIVQAANAGAQATNITNVYSSLTTGYNGGLWTGTGLTSPTVAADAQVNGVLGVMLYDNTQINFANFSGLTGLVAPFEQVLTRITYIGDYDSSGSLDGTDYSYLDAYLGGGQTPQGDLNFDGVLNGLDYSLIDAVLGGQAYGSLTSTGSAVNLQPKSGTVPEPTSFSLLALGLIGCFNRRFNRKFISQ